MRIPITAWLLLLAPLTGATAQTATTDTIFEDDLSALSFEELMDIPITSQARKSVKISDTMAAVYVITAEDIHDLALTSIPEALRLVPGVQVARIDANKYAISVRGMNSRFSDMLLVMIDGRTVYNPLFSGVLWEAVDVNMDDIERIEVIRGPGATMWGANAVNGVINIITRSAAETQGGIIVNRTGTAETYTGSARWGGRLGGDAYYRVSGRFRRHDNFETADGSAVNDASETGHGSGRVDWQRGDDRLTFQARYGRATIAENDYALTSNTPPYGGFLLEDAHATEAHALGRWEHVDSFGGQMAVQAFVDHVDYDYPTFAARHNTTDIELQYRPHIAGRHEIVFGLGARVIDTETIGSFSFRFRPRNRQDLLAQAFAQDEVSLVPEKLDLAFGAKIEHNEFTGFELQPNVRLRWRPDARYTLWASRARAVRTPSIGLQTINLLLEILPAGDPANPAPLPLQVRFHGNRDAESVRVYAHEIGARAQLTPTLSADLALYHNDYDHVEEPQLGEITLGGRVGQLFLVQPVLQVNDAKQKIYGGELALEYRPAGFWQLRGWASLCRRESEMSSSGPMPERAVDPEYQAALRSLFMLPGPVHASLFLRHVSALPDVDAYTELDAALGWHASPRFFVALGARNLLHEHHLEFVQDTIIVSPATVVPRSYSAWVRWGF